MKAQDLYVFLLKVKILSSLQSLSPETLEKYSVRISPDHSTLMAPQFGLDRGLIGMRLFSVDVTTVDDVEKKKMVAKTIPRYHV